MWKWLFEQDFMPHGHCYFWRPDILWMHVISNGVIALAYYSIPITLVYFASKRRDIPFRGVLALFAAFIVLCGTTHILGIITIWNPIYAMDGAVKALTAVVSIVTAAVLVPLVPKALAMRMPAELERANALLLEEIERRKQAEVQMQAAVEELRRSNEELEQFASVASHDLQSPLRGVITFTQLLKQELGEKLDPESRELFGFIEDGGKRMQRLITDLLQISRVSKDHKPHVRVSVGQALDEVRQTLKAAIDEKSADIAAGEMPEVTGNHGQIVQLLQNLIDNAVKYSRPGVSPRVVLTVSAEGDWWHFVLHDNGIGIPAEHLNSIFSLFKRLHTDDQYPGTGIGLALCKKIVDRHGGRIWVESVDGGGSDFHFTLPAAQARMQEGGSAGPLGEALG
jgi:signal transduction histidine kinase